MVQFLSIIFFSWISSIFGGFSRVLVFLCHLVYEGLIGLDFVRYHAMRKEVEEKEVCVITRAILLHSEKRLFVNRTFVNV